MVGCWSWRVECIGVQSQSSKSKCGGSLPVLRPVFLSALRSFSNGRHTMSAAPGSSEEDSKPSLSTSSAFIASDKTCPDCGSSGTLLQCEGGCQRQLCSDPKCKANNPKTCRYCSGRCCSACVNRYGPGLYLCKECSSQICGR